MAAAPVSPWARVPSTTTATSLRDVLSEQLAEQLQLEEEPTMQPLNSLSAASEEFSVANPLTEAGSFESNPITAAEGSFSEEKSGDSDFLLAKLLQEQFDAEYDHIVQLRERQLNGNSKVAVSLENFKLKSRAERELLTAEDAESAAIDSASEEDEPPPVFNKKGICVQGDKIVTKHDADLNSKLNVTRMNAFNLAMNTGDSHTFESTRINNRVFNQLKIASYAIGKRDERMHERREEQATNVKAVDKRTRLLLFKLVNNGTLQTLNGVVAEGKESVILHAVAAPRRQKSNSGSSAKSNEGAEANADEEVDSDDVDSDNEQVTEAGSSAELQDGLCECAVKVYKTTLTDFKTRAAYVCGDPRFLRDEFKKQNPRKIIRIWAEKEFVNLRRLRQFGILCPDAIALKKHCLLMTFIGSNRVAAPCLRNVALTVDEWRVAYDQVCQSMCDMYQRAGLVHGDLSEYNLLWHNGRVWMIDVSQSVDQSHPQSWPFLLRDVRNITRFFASRGLKMKRVVGCETEGQVDSTSGGLGSESVEGDLDSVEALFNRVTQAGLEGEGDTWMKAFANYVANARQYKRVTSMLHYGAEEGPSSWSADGGIVDANDDVEDEIWQFIQLQKGSADS